MTSAAGPRSIVVAIDSSTNARAALEVAAELARNLRAEVRAVFVEDVDLVRLAGLPFSREIGSDAQIRPFDMPRLERRFRSEARLVREACTKAAQRSHIQVHFEVARGEVASAILTAAESAEMVVLGRASASPLGRPLLVRRPETSRRRRRPLGRTARSVLAGSTRTVAIASEERGIGRPVAVVYDGSEASERALELALHLAGADHHTLRMLVPANQARAAEFAALAAAAARNVGIEPHCEVLADGREAILEALARSDCRALILNHRCALLEDGGVEGLIERVDCPVLVVR